MLPKPIAPQTLLKMKQDPHAYETAKQTIDAHNQLIAALGPGANINPTSFSLSGGFGKITGINGTFKRGYFTIVCDGNVIGASPKITLSFPSGTWGTRPFATVTRNGGNGSLSYSFTESVNALVITLEGTPVAGSTYGFNYAIRD